MAGFEVDAVARLLGACAAAIRTEVEALPDAVHGWHPASGEWCINEVLGHLLEAGDQEAVTRARGDCERPVGHLLAEFLAERVMSVELVQALSQESLDRGGEHVTVGHVTVRELLQEWVHHDRNHLKQLLANVQAYAWEGMGNTRRFSDV